MSTKRYFESIGAWPTGSGHMERTYVLGFLASLVLTLGAYVVAVNHVVSANFVVFFVLVCACLQFMIQVLNFLHVSGEKSSRERLIVLGCTAVIMLILVIGSMLIMNDLDARMMPDGDVVEKYMQREQGI